MRKGTVLLLTLTSLSAAASILSWRAWREERARADSLQAQVAQHSRQVAGLVAPAGTPVLVRTGTPSDGRGAVPAAPDLEADPFADYEYRLMQNPDYLAARRRNRLLEMAEGHVDLADVLGISAETADRLLALLVDQEMRYLGEPRRNPRNEEELQARREENERLRAEANAEIAGVIGEFKLEAWHDYQARLPYRHRVRELRLELSESAYPLSEKQVEPLIEVIYAEVERTRRELDEFSAGLVWSDGMEVKSNRYLEARQAELARESDERLRASAGRILSREQLAAYIDMRRRERDRQAAHSEMRRAAIEAQRLADGGD